MYFQNVLFNLCLNHGMYLQVWFILFVSAQWAVFFSLEVCGTLIKTGRGDHPEIFGLQGPVLASFGNCDALKIGQISQTHNTDHYSLILAYLTLPIFRSYSWKPEVQSSHFASVNFKGYLSCKCFWFFTINEVSICVCLYQMNKNPSPIVGDLKQLVWGFYLKKK